MKPCRCPGIDRRQFLLRLGGSVPLLLGVPPAFAREATTSPLASAPPLIPAPADSAQWPAFREALHSWRTREQQRLDYNDQRYANPENSWTQHIYCCGFLMLFDAALYHPQQAVYQVESVLNDAERQFGGYDAVVLWHAYPRIGADPRNQFDFYRDQPGGILGLRQVIREFHERDVRVFLNYNPWDTGTRREPRTDVEVLSTLIQALDADGLFLDTLDQAIGNLPDQLQNDRPGTVLESELALPLDRVTDHHLSWAQGLVDSRVPGIFRNKWFERRHHLHLVDRWALDHTAELHAAWMNGTGVLVWENVFGSWVGWNPRDCSILRTMLPIQRRFSDLLTGGRWTPLVPTQTKDIYASLWEDTHLRLWTLVNRADQPREGPLLTFTPRPHLPCFDLVTGETVPLQTPGRGLACWTGRLRPRGIGCFLEAPLGALGDAFPEFLTRQQQLRQRYDESATARVVLTSAPALRATKRRHRPPPGMITIPGGRLHLETTLRVRECGFYVSVPPPDHRLASSYTPSLERFTHDLTLESFALDATPVTNAQFTRFLNESGYRPQHPENFLKHWGHGHAPYGHEEHPVVWVDLQDAEAYAGWAGKRLPTDYEWQFAAQGHAAHRYPWGHDWLPQCANDGSDGAHTTPVKHFPQGRSPFGVWDLCGNVWEWTASLRTDGHTRFCLLKGGSYYRAQGSNWYFEGGPQPNQHAAKFILSWPGLDRCATIGFRCAVDLVQARRG